MKKIFLYLAFLFIVVSIVYGLGVSGSVLRHRMDFRPGAVKEDTYVLTSREEYTATYIIKPVYRYGADLTPYFTITPSRIENVGPGESATFTVRFELPEYIDVPGESLAWVRTEIEPQGGGLMAYPAVALSYYVFVLYPYKYARWSLSVPNMNVNETADFTVTLENLGEPDILASYADIRVVSTQTNLTVANVKTGTERNIKSRETRELKAKFDSTVAQAGDYVAYATIYWDQNVSTDEKPFRIGTKSVKILNYTKTFEIDAINRMEISIESAWNNKLQNVYASVEVYDAEAKVKEFKSVSTDLMPWENKVIDAYFDTSGLSKKDYKGQVVLHYEGEEASSDATFSIGEDIGAKTVEEIPGSFSFKSVGNIFSSFSMMHAMMVLLAVFIIINLVLVYMMIKRKTEEPLDPSILEHIRELKQKYNDAYIKDLMIKKGWAEQKVERALKEAKR